MAYERARALTSKYIPEIEEANPLLITSFSAFWAGIALGFVSTPLYTWEL